MSTAIAMVATFGAYLLLVFVAGLAGGVDPSRRTLAHALAAMVAICFGLVLGLWHSGVCS